MYKALLASLSSLWLCVTLHCGIVSTVGLQAALDMQEKITARREQIDTLQGKIQHLEETVEKLCQVKIFSVHVWKNNVRFRLNAVSHNFMNINIRNTPFLSMKSAIHFM